MRACVRVCVRTCVRACVCMYVYMFVDQCLRNTVDLTHRIANKSIQSAARTYKCLLSVRVTNDI